MLYGTRFLPDYPQCALKLGRFRGTRVTGEIVDNRQEHLNAFAAVREGMAFLDRTLPLGARFPKGTIFREDRLPVPPEALREILLNAVMHRDYSDPGGYVAIAIFDDRVEISSFGRFPSGMIADQLSRTHLSKLRNLLIAEAFHRTGAVEIWGRGTNRVIEACREHGIQAPVFEERQGFVIVTFRAPIAATAGTPLAAPSRDQVGTKSGPSRDQVALLEACRLERSLTELMEVVGRKNRSKFRDQFIRPLLKTGLIELTVPARPKSRLQKYRLTKSGVTALEATGETHE